MCFVIWSGQQVNVANKTSDCWFSLTHSKAKVLGAGYSQCIFHPERLPMSQPGGETHSDSGLLSLCREKSGCHIRQRFNHPKCQYSPAEPLKLKTLSPCSQYCETLEVRSQKMNLGVTLCGEGVLQAVSCSHPGGELDFGYVLPKDRTSQVFQVSCAAGLEEAERSPLT